ncbi:MAG: hypothetical protein BMS9Abin05_1977 [Rhodothermia bacterium]|nr:MAG: hypothetical protein BMS9Abin05_1977 [Rhodothermia bacterium]
MSNESVSALTKPGFFDLILIALGVIGFGIFAFVLPAYHIDGTAEYRISESDAIDKANVFLVSNGYSVRNLDIEAHLGRNDELLQDMQEDLGRDRTIEILRDEENSTLPGFLWSVSYRMKNPDASSSISFAGSAQVFRVVLNIDGAVLEFENTSSSGGAASASLGTATRSVNRSVLAELFTPGDSLRSEIFARLGAVSDSSLFASLSFKDLDIPDMRTEPGSASRIDRLEQNLSVRLDSSDILKLANMLAPEQALKEMTWEVDSLRVFSSNASDNISGNSKQLALVRLATTELMFGQQWRVDMTVSSTGNLQEMVVVSNPDREVDDTVSTVLGVVRGGAYFLLAIVMVVFFVRRITARLVDVKGSMIDALAVGVLFGILVVMNSQIFLNSDVTTWARVIASLLAFSFVGGAFALAVFILSGATESITREIFPQKLLSGILFRKGEFHNLVVGWALVRGISVAGALVGIGVVALAIFPNLLLDLGPSLEAEKTFRPVLANFASSSGLSLLISALVLLGVGTLAYRLVGRPWFVVGCITIVGGFLRIDPYGLEVSWLAVGISGIVALILAVSYMRFDFLTAFIGLFIATFAWSLSEGFLISQSPVWLDTLLAVFFIASITLIGIIGVFSRRAEGDIHEYVPDYIKELAGQERIKREVEIAYQVQASFLPRTMPDIDGLDIAGMCLPASEIGGDYFDFIHLPNNKLAFVVGDVSGKGIQAAFYMTLVKGVIQTLSTSELSPCAVMKRLNEVFRKNAPAGTFISAIYGIVDPGSGEFTFARAGHNPGILKRSDQAEPEFLRPNGMAIGFTDGQVFDDSMAEVSIRLNKGDVLVFYTDGFSEAMNSKRELYGDDRLRVKVGHVGNRSAGGILRSLTEDVHHFIEAAGRSDDMTMVVVKMSG